MLQACLRGLGLGRPGRLGSGRPRRLPEARVDRLVFLQRPGPRQPWLSVPCLSARLRSLKIREGEMSLPFHCYQWGLCFRNRSGVTFHPASLVGVGFSQTKVRGPSRWPAGAAPPGES